MRAFSLALAVLLLATASVLADAIVTKDGKRIEGDLNRVGDDWHVKSADGSVTVVPARDVRSIELGSGGSSGSAAQARLASLRRSVEALRDLDQIVERFERFIENTNDPDVAKQARQDLAEWQKRKEQGLVKQGGEWVSPEEAERIKQRAIQTAAEVRDLLRQGRLPDAEAALQRALEEDPDSPAALFLRGVMLYRQDKLVDARKSFEAVNQQINDHAPTLNNLAIIVWRQNQQGPALSYFDQAMQFQPVNKFILDNVAEALGTLPEDQRKSQTLQRIIRRFTEQDTLLQQQMAPRGLYRWGSQWVDQQQLEELKEAEKAVQAKLQEIEAQFERNKRRIAEIDARIRANQRTMDDMQARTLWRDSEGRLHRMPLPDTYYQLRAENEHLRIEQDRLQQGFNALREDHRKTQQQLPVPRFTGVMQLVGAEGAPLLPPPAPMSAPAAEAPPGSPTLAPSTAPGGGR